MQPWAVLQISPLESQGIGLFWAVVQRAWFGGLGEFPVLDVFFSLQTNKSVTLLGLFANHTQTPRKTWEIVSRAECCQRWNQDSTHCCCPDWNSQLLRSQVGCTEHWSSSRGLTPLLLGPQSMWLGRTVWGSWGTHVASLCILVFWSRISWLTETALETLSKWTGVL
jgi:hypothetical protein